MTFNEWAAREYMVPVSDLENYHFRADQTGVDLYSHLEGCWKAAFEEALQQIDLIDACEAAYNDGYYTGFANGEEEGAGK